MLDILNNYDWAEVFGEGSGGNCGIILPEVTPADSELSGESFGREDVASVLGIVEGERDESSWIIWGILNDGRYFFAEFGRRIL